jgi:hypothetical protein
MPPCSAAAHPRARIGPGGKYATGRRPVPRRRAGGPRRAPGESPVSDSATRVREICVLGDLLAAWRRHCSGPRYGVSHDWTIDSPLASRPGQWRSGAGRSAGDRFSLSPGGVASVARERAATFREPEERGDRLGDRASRSRRDPHSTGPCRFAERVSGRRRPPRRRRGAPRGRRPNWPPCSTRGRPARRASRPRHRAPSPRPCT